MSTFNAQDVTNVAWAFARMNHEDEKLFAALASRAHRLACQFKGLANKGKKRNTGKERKTNKSKTKGKKYEKKTEKTNEERKTDRHK